MIYLLKPKISFFREKKKEKEREELWKRLGSLELNPQDTSNPPHILTDTPMTSFISPRERKDILAAPTNAGANATSATATNSTSSTSGEKSPGSGKKTSSSSASNQPVAAAGETTKK